MKRGLLDFLIILKEEGLALSLTLRPKIVDLVNEPCMLAPVAVHVPARLVLEIVEFLLANVLPDSADLLHDVEGRNVRVASHNFRPCLKVRDNMHTSRTKSM
jgi:hypothetical protein